jgi:ATP-binding cassette, subfamily B, bacterial MsbA
MTDQAHTAATPAPERSDWQTYKRLMRYVLPMWPLFLLALIGFILGNGAEAYFARLFGDIIEAFEGRTERTWIYFPIAMLIVVVVRAFGEFMGQFFLSRISFRVVHQIRCELFEQLLQMPSGYFDQSTKGHLVSRITYNVAQLRDTATDVSKSFIQDGTKVLILLGAMFWANWKLTMIFLCVAPLVAIVVSYASVRFRRISRKIQSSMGDVTHVTSESVNGYRVVRIYGGEDYERARFVGASVHNSRQNLKMVATKVVSTQIIQFFVAAALALLVALLFQPGVAGDMSAGDVVFFIGLAGLLANPIRKLSEINAKLQRGLAAAEDIFDQLDQEVEQDTGRYQAERVQGYIQYQNVNFSYSGTKGRVLHDINIEIQPGQTVALVGKSGSGKSTMVSLLPRFYELSGGQILLDGRPLTDYALRSLRNQIALVTQEVVLFNDTLERNIAYGVLEQKSPEEIWDAIVRAHADGFISKLPEGLNTVVGDNGIMLSGGQRQRVAIARALLKDAPILILDEATSALDTESEKYIQAALEEVMRGRTTLVIAHRLSTIENADVILVVDDGRIVEQGAHEALLAQGGVYASLYNSQFEEPAAGEGPGAAVKRAPANVARPRSASVPAPAHAGSQGTSRGQDGPVAIRPLNGNGRNGLTTSRLHGMTEGWYGNAWWTQLLRPVGALYRWQATRRRHGYQIGRYRSWRAPVPVIIVGNITVGGTGKTPFVIWLVNWLKRQGFRPGVVSRGYGGQGIYPLAVSPETSVVEAGDEAPLIARQTAVPVVVDPDRPRAVRHLLDHHRCDLIVSDDGLQHYQLARDVEILLLDGQRGLGNRLCLPAGPLREPPERLNEVDFVVVNGRQTGLVAPEWTMEVEAAGLSNLHDGEQVSVAQWLGRVSDRRVHAVAGIGNPTRFFKTLASLGFVPIGKGLVDHHLFDGEELLFDDNLPVIVTEKDASKIRALSPERIPVNCWSLDIRAKLTVEGTLALQQLLRDRGIINHAASPDSADTAGEASGSASMGTRSD